MSHRASLMAEQELDSSFNNKIKLLNTFYVPRYSRYFTCPVGSNNSVRWVLLSPFGK